MSDAPVINASEWEYRVWEPCFELINKSNGLREFYFGNNFDKTLYSVARRIDHDHCMECMTTISDQKLHQQKGYYNPEEGWLCKQCYKKLVKS